MMLLKLLSQTYRPLTSLNLNLTRNNSLLISRKCLKSEITPFKRFIHCTSVSANHSSEKLPHENHQSDSNKSRFSRIFDYFRKSENTWKISLGILSFMLLNGAIYGLFEWGKPMIDNDGNEVKDKYSECKFFFFI
jgi:hypothetical protein